MASALVEVVPVSAASGVPEVVCSLAGALDFCPNNCCQNPDDEVAGSDVAGAVDGWETPGVLGSSVVWLAASATVGALGAAEEVVPGPVVGSPFVELVVSVFMSVLDDGPGTLASGWVVD